MASNGAGQSRWGRILRRLLIAACLFVLMLAAISGIYEAIAERRAAATCPMTGRLVDVGGFRLFLNCTGKGSPAVILESGALDSSRQWQQVQPAVAATTRVCSYDRAGFGWSDLSTSPRTARQMALELHTLLLNSEVQPPYVLVGHSFGGLVTQIFSTMYANEVAGVVLEDSIHPEETVQFPDRFPRQTAISTFLRLTVPLGLPRFLGWCDRTAACPDCVKFTKSALAEYDSYFESHAQAAGTGRLGDKPLIVLAHDPAVGLGGDRDRDEAYEKGWTVFQQELSHLSSNSTLAVITGVSHEIQTLQPQIVTNAILKVVSEVRSSQIH